MELFTEALLSAAEERELARRIEAGVTAAAVAQGRFTARNAATEGELAILMAQGEAAHRRFVLANLRLVAHVAGAEARRTGLSRDELFQEGVVGLLEAVQRWDHRRELRFSTYAVVRIRKNVHEAALTRLGATGLPAHAAAAWIRVRRAEAEAAGDLQAAAAAVGVSVATVRRWLAYAPPSELPDRWSEAVAAASTEESPKIPAAPALAELVASLPEPLRQIVRWRYGLGTPPLSTAAVAQRLGLSARHVRRLESRALEFLRDDLPHEVAA